MKQIKRGSLWRHRNGNEYRVLFLVNEYSKNLDKYPVRVVFEGLTNHRRWEKTVESFTETMTEITDRSPYSLWIPISGFFRTFRS